MHVFRCIGLYINTFYLITQLLDLLLPRLLHIIQIIKSKLLLEMVEIFIKNI